MRSNSLPKTVPAGSVKPLPKASKARRLYTLDGVPMTAEEIAIACDCSEATVRNRTRSRGPHLSRASLAQTHIRKPRTEPAPIGPVCNTAEERAKLNQIPGPSAFERANARWMLGSGPDAESNRM